MLSFGLQAVHIIIDYFISSLVDHLSLQVTFLFALEAILKITARGFASYFNSKTDALDLFVAATSLTDEMVRFDNEYVCNDFWLDASHAR